MKVTGPHQVDVQIKKGEYKFEKRELFIFTKDFPRPHFVVIVSIVENADYPHTTFAVSYLITHSSSYNNEKVIDGLFEHSTIPLNESYITRDKFLLDIQDIEMDNLYGYVNIDKLNTFLEY